MGMGGDLLAEILSRDWSLSSSFKRFVLQPVRRPYVPRGLLAEKGWPLIDERVIKLKGAFCALQLPTRRPPLPVKPPGLEVGPLLLQARDRMNWNTSIIAGESFNTSRKACLYQNWRTIKTGALNMNRCAEDWRGHNQWQIRVKDIVAILEHHYPPYLASSWDNCGLQLGSYSAPVKKVGVALELEPEWSKRR